jgi:uncharacterized protein YkwD
MGDGSNRFFLTVTTVLLLVVIALATPLVLDSGGFSADHLSKYIVDFLDQYGILSTNIEAPTPSIIVIDQDAIEDEPSVQGKDTEKPVDSTPVSLQIDSYPTIVRDHLELMNKERQSQGLSALTLNSNLSAVANWVGAVQAQNDQSPEVSEVKSRLAPYPELAVTAFALNRISATDTKGDRFIQWFADGRQSDVSSSQSLREHLLNREITHVGLACVGVPVEVDGKKQYRMAFVWLFMQQPPPSGVTNQSAMAAENIAILNVERSGRNLGTLKSHSTLNDLAYIKAKDILENLPYNGLAHESQRLGSPNEMIVAHVSPTPRGTAENLWTQWGSYHKGFLTETAQQAHDGLMNSEGHRKNMLTPEFTHIGVGVAAGIVEGHYKVVLVQLFIIQH